MTRRDLGWRGAGVMIFALALAIGGASTPAAGPAGLLCMAMALIGVLLIVQGKNLPAALRIERSRHRVLAHAIRQRRRRAATYEDR